ncbi:ROK family protein [Paenibacillus sp. WLX2291]|uniref:ROK family protein n=1 Tax=Paenibacillus sp. WLX2291 TaxID=3296934 RepID=UPI003983EB7E
MKNANANLMKEINLNNVRQVMKRIETATKPQLASLTGLSVVTVNSLIRELLERGEIYEDQTVPSNGGRPALTYRYNYNFSLGLVIGIKDEQGKILISAIVINLEDETIFKKEQAIPVFEQEELFQLIEECLSQHGDIKVIGIGLPGQVMDGVVAVSSHHELEGVHIIQLVEQRFGLPVLLENDVNAAVSGYCARHDLEGNETVVSVYFPPLHPPGMGIHLDGQLVRGKNGMAGEIKFLPLSIDWYASMESTAFADIACRIIQSVNAILAPERVVMYQELLTDAQWEQHWQSYQQQYVMPSYPDVVLESDFQHDFEAGMRWLTLKQLTPSLSY